MAVDIDFTITNSSNGKTYFFRGVHNVRSRRKQNPIQIPLISTPAATNVLFRFTGQQDELSLNFYIFNDGVDVGNGENIKTIDQQIAYLRDEIFTHEFDTSWKLVDANARFTPSGGFDGVLTTLDTPGEMGVPTFVIGSISFVRGLIVNL